MAKNELHVVFGANGNIGNLLIHELVLQGKKVRGVTRNGKADVPAGVELVSADALDLEATKKAAEGANILYHCIGLPYSEWEAKHPTIMANIIEAAAAQGNDTKVVFPDNLYMYGKENVLKGPLREDMPHLAKGKKGKVRSQLANQLMKAHEEGRIKVTIGRGSDFFGPKGTNSILGILVFLNVLEGEKVSMPGDLDKKHSYIYLEDFVKGLITLAESEKAFGEVWHLPHGETQTTREVIEIAFAEAEVDPKDKIGAMSNIMLTIGGLFNKMARDAKETNYQRENDWIVDHSKFDKAFNFSTTPNREAIRKTLDWYRANLK